MSDITVDVSQVVGNLEELLPRVKAGAEVIGNNTGAKMKTYAQTNARWQNRTSAARGGLSYKCTWEGDVLDIALFHVVDYGLWLEVRNFPHAGRLAILQEARDSQVNAFTSAIKNLL